MEPSLITETTHPVWNAEHAQSWLRELVQKKVVAPGRALVVSADLAEEAATLAHLGFRVLLIDPRSEAIDRAKQTARERKVELDTMKADLLATRSSFFGSVDLLYDRTLFHSLEPIRRADWVHAVSRVLPRHGMLAGFFRVGRNSAGPPFAVEKAGLEKLLGRHFETEQLLEAGSVPLGTDEAYQGLFRKK